MVDVVTASLQFETLEGLFSGMRSMMNSDQFNRHDMRICCVRNLINDYLLSAQAYKELLEKERSLLIASIHNETSVALGIIMVLDDPFPDPADWPAEEPASPDEIIDERLQTDLDDQEEEEIEERRANAQAQAQSIGLELMGDLPDAEVIASDKELFVCQLNEVTEDEDLKTIFERFGPIKSCDVVRDFKTGESLQYAFIEFETKEACEMAYVKMQNVVIDDKRIKVDFSQSVSKQWREIRQKQREEIRRAARGERPRRRDDNEWVYMLM
ncbi:single-stranded G-strand telomeric DNA-binding protein, putative [Perkinsus marinus ATCC 50983]|uniref:peptidylprolyl isomerase n=1 Tax=Perkinsus marinus (strain ATCC 50983 / TXsc) TaxID=423536 RepID=C5KE03_PERM5|nr:single-stranded G-strand telomeric DNA-binding protein, putative [Perkinsus marinus ATCC 50983]EER17288.1 single-stranded G-strand telomeric DNA-binding protein, putative [Perkinsus marinus ATCC 50983]|eukprot:XP_002785492.1 single-stranded G-strand telomeric DNA-binding protein, putative [Perkinsus marinus ATCC 50983]